MKPTTAPAELLAAEPAALTKIKIGYARVSTGGQNLDRQIDALTRAGCRRIFADKKSGKDTDRPELAAALQFLQAGDTLVVPALDRFGRSLSDLITMVGELRRCGIGFTSLHENLDTTTPGGRLVFHVFAAIAEFIRELIVSGTREGLAAARERSRVGGRPTVATPEVTGPPATCYPTPNTASPQSPNCSVSAPVPSTTTSPTCASCDLAHARVPAAVARSVPPSAGPEPGRIRTPTGAIRPLAASLPPLSVPLFPEGRVAHHDGAIAVRGRQQRRLAQHLLDGRRAHTIGAGHPTSTSSRRKPNPALQGSTSRRPAASGRSI